MILAIDPGTARIGMVLYDPSAKQVVQHWDPEEVDESTVFGAMKLALRGDWTVLVERVQAQGVAGTSTIDTADQAGWIRGVCEAWGIMCHRMYRREVKAALDCAGGKDKDVKARVCEYLVGSSNWRDATGKKSAPGPCYGLKGDAWQALGLAIGWLHANNAQ